MKRNVKLLGTGAYLPERIVTASEMDRLINAKEGWSEKKSGVKQRHFVSGQETASYMGAEAAKEALKEAGITLGEIDCIIGASGTMEQPIPCNASLIQEALGKEAGGIPCFDINATCLSFVTALDTISYLLHAGRYQRVLLVSSEIASVGINFEQNESSILFGDGAVAAVFSRTEESSHIIASHMRTYSDGAHFAEIAGGGTKLHAKHYQEENKNPYLFHMDGTSIFKLSSRKLPSFMNELFEGTEMDLSDVDLLIPHQASASAMKIIRRKLGVKQELFMNIIENYGNMISASIPLGLHLAIQQGRLKRGNKVLLLGTSAGLSIGGVLFEY